MTQAPQAVPAGWYPSPDGAPVHRWWDGTMWTDATHPPQAPAQPDPVERVEPVTEAGKARGCGFGAQEATKNDVAPSA